MPEHVVKDVLHSRARDALDDRLKRVRETDGCALSLCLLRSVSRVRPDLVDTSTYMRLVGVHSLVYVRKWFLVILLGGLMGNCFRMV